MTSAPNRDARQHVAMFIADRWSPRSFEPKVLPAETLLDIIDAGRWAPSAYNTQTWHFLHAGRNTPAWENFLSWLTPFNQSWAKDASAIIYVVSKVNAVSPQSGGLHPDAARSIRRPLPADGSNPDKKKYGNVTFTSFLLIFARRSG